MKKLAIALAIIYFIAISGSIVYSLSSRDMIDYIKSGNLEKLERQLERDKSIEEIYNALCNAIYNEKVEAVKIILNNINVDDYDAKGYTPLFLAIEVGNQDIINMLIDRGVDINDVDFHNETTIEKALSRHNYSLVSTLIERGADLSRANVSFPLVKREMEKADKDTIEKLVKIAADNTNVEKSDNIKTFFGAAVYTKNYELLDFLNEKYKDTTYLYSAFKYSLINSDTEMADYIYGKGEILFDEKNILEIIYILDNCSVDTIKHVVDNYDKSDNKVSVGLVKRSLWINRLEIAEYVLHKGIDVNKLNITGADAPIFTAITKCDVDAVKLLLDYNVPTDVVNMDGEDVFGALEEVKNSVDWLDFGNRKKLDDIYKKLKKL